MTQRQRYGLAIVLASGAVFFTLRSGQLRADPPQAQSNADQLQDPCQWVWYVQNLTAVTHDPDSAGVAAVLRVHRLLVDKPDVESAFLQKMLFDAKSHAVQRAIRLRLADLYDSANRQDQAMEQLQTLITEAP